MLSPYAELYYPETERLVCEKETTEKVNNKQNEIVSGTNQKKQELKDIIKKLTLYNAVSLKNSKEYLKQF